LKSYENKPTDEMIVPDGLVPEENEIDGGDSDAIATIDHVPEREEELAEAVAERDEEVDVPLDEDEYDEYVEEDEKSIRRHSWPPTREQLWTASAFGAVLLLGAFLRFWGLGDKPLHWDESLHAYFSLVLLHNNVDNWAVCAKTAAASCYRYDPLTHGPFQFHAIAFVYQISQWLGAPDHGVNPTTVRIAAATLGTVIVGLPFLLRFHIGKVAAWLSCLLIAISPSLVYYSRFAREDIYMLCFTFMLVIGVVRYLRSRNPWWLLMAALSLTLSYTTSEATFLTIGVFGSFFGAVIVWELGLRWSLSSNDEQSSTSAKRYLPKTAAPWVVLVYFVIVGIIAKLVLNEVASLGKYVAANTSISDAYVAHLKATTEAILPWLGIILAVIVFVLLLRERKESVSQERRGLARRIDPKKQRLLDTIVTMNWTHWFFALVCSWFVFMILFTVLFTNVPGGLGDGIWQGLYYWTQQQQVARGGQPWYYYFLLIPLYEQIGLVFGLVGVVYCLLRPTRLRLFLVFWFVGNMFIFSWAGEKMPWLSINMTLPMMILAAIALQPAVVVVLNAIKVRLGYGGQATAVPESVAFDSSPIEGVAVDSLATENAEGDSLAIESADDNSLSVESEDALPVDKVVYESILPVTPAIVPPSPRPVRRHRYALVGSVVTVVLALVLLVPTVQNMFQLSFVHYADAPHEMMIYVQTTTDVDTVMSKIDALDQKLYGGNHKMPIGIVSDSTWPFSWYVRDYTNVCFNYPTGCSAEVAQSIPVVIASGDEMTTLQNQYSQTYLFHEYPSRTQWDQGYMPPPCKRSATNPCTAVQQYVGVGPWLWLSYGDNPPPGATFNFGKAVSNIWQWIWYRKAFGSTDGAYNMGLFIKDDASAKTGIKP
jgi:uncharacterized protein (TIGR03663 family)